jgi:replicative DNA helicase
MIDAGATDRALQIVTPGDFYREAHRQIFAAIRTVHEADRPADLVTVAAELRRRGLLEAVGGGEYLTALISEVPTAAHVVAYAREVARTAILRQVIAAAADAQVRSYENPDDPAELLGQVTIRLDQLQERCRTGSEPRPVTDLLADDIPEIESRMDRPHEVSLVRWGIPDLDRRTGGLEDAGYMLLKGNTNAGKTSLLTQIIVETARAIRAEGAGNRVVLHFGMEERSWRWMQRAVCLMGRVDSRALRNAPTLARVAEVDPDILGRFWTAVGEYNELPILLAAGSQSLGSIEAYCKRIMRKYKPLLVTVDYLQKLRKDEGEYETEERAFREVADRMERLRDMLGCPIIGTSQVTQGADGHANPFGARAFEFSADVAVNIHRTRDENQQWRPTCGIVCEKTRELVNFGVFEAHTDFATGRWAAVDTQHE